MRFVIAQIDKNSRKAQGLFVAAYSLLDSGTLKGDEWKRVRGILDWFNKNLPHPPDDFATGRAIFWFKSSAKECIGQIWEFGSPSYGSTGITSKCISVDTWPIFVIRIRFRSRPTLQSETAE